MKRKTKRRIGFLTGFAVYFGLIWFFWSSPAVYPLKIFVVLLHELSHAVAIWITGGVVEGITLDPAQGGVTYGRGGNAFLGLSAGYLGSLLWGVVLVVAGYGRRVPAAGVLAATAVVVLALTVVHVRGGFGLLFCILFGAFLLLAAWRLPDIWNRRILLVLGLTSCLYAILDIKSDVLDRPHLPSDALLLARMTGVPTVVWGVLWIGAALLVSGLLFRWAWRRA
ncbi:MAG: M50 family metallopeptidase [Gemmatimonadetes bacterium]|nr:M50 family metallopeptidase [Gemmatimonadota bacterium]